MADVVDYLPLVRATPLPLSELYGFLLQYYSRQEPLDRLTLVEAEMGGLMLLSSEAFHLLLPYFLEFYSRTSTRVRALALFDKLCEKLKHMAKQHLLTPLMHLYEVKGDATLQMELFKVQFLMVVRDSFGIECFFANILPYLVDALRSSDINIKQIAQASISLFVTSLSPVIATRYFVYPLLNLLGRSAVDANVVVHTLVAAGVHLGETVIVDQYVPRMRELLQQNSSVASKAQHDSTVLTVLSLVNGLLEFMQPATALRSFVTQSSQLIVLLLNPSPNVTLLQALGDTLVRIAEHIGRVRTRIYLLPYLNQFFSNYSDFYGSDGKRVVGTEEGVRAHYRKIYSPQMASLLYGDFSRAVGRDLMQDEISNSALIESILRHHPHLILPPMPSPQEKKAVSRVVEKSPAAAKVPRRKSLSFIEATKTNPLKDEEDAQLLAERREEELQVAAEHAERMELEEEEMQWERRLERSWIHQLLESDRLPYERPEFEFKNRITYSAKIHNNSIECLAVSKTENLILSACKDRSLKMWTLDETQFSSSSVDHHSLSGIPCFVSYGLHHAQITACCFHPHRDQVVSVDGSLHIWDINAGKNLLHLVHRSKLQDISPLLCASNAECHFVATTLTGSVVLLDTRMGIVAQEWKVQVGQTRGLAVDDDRFVVSCGNSTGWITTLDGRFGRVQERWKAHEGAICRLEQIHEKKVVSSGFDKSIKIWNDVPFFSAEVPTASSNSPSTSFPFAPSKDTQRGRVANTTIRGYGDPVTGFARMDNLLLCVGGSKMACVPFSQEGIYRASPNKPLNARAEKVRCVAALPYHGMFALGCEDGSLRFCL
eukprot:TRINITY_DN11640_c0_g1_i2.p1 TRINITY_DN11640_c0_g1~~TRINITY_DN11640_c0_g1_i2.p1  ORF type:complete len:975 (-),score=286.48 TRINITY_DN11640_c0_g1_i2:107-2593(-)